MIATVNAINAIRSDVFDTFIKATYKKKTSAAPSTTSHTTMPIIFRHSYSLERIRFTNNSFVPLSSLFTLCIVPQLSPNYKFLPQCASKTTSLDIFSIFITTYGKLGFSRTVSSFDGPLNSVLRKILSFVSVNFLTSML